MRLWLLGAACGASPACFLHLDERIACGDGYVDTEAGEQCDPRVESSFINACRPEDSDEKGPFGVAACDATTCTILNGPEQCRICGNDIVEPGEECDGTNFNGNTCPNGSNELRCIDCQISYESCPACGNEVLEPSEECDPTAASGPVFPLQCVEIEAKSQGVEYGSGASSRCTAECEFDRSECSYCGNGEVDGAILVYDEIFSVPETCDGETRGANFDAECRAKCDMIGVDDSATVDCASKCAEDCSRYEQMTCCRPPGADCPDDSQQVDPWRCCWELDPANSSTTPQSACRELTGTGRFVCR